MRHTEQGGVREDRHATKKFPHELAVFLAQMCAPRGTRGTRALRMMAGFFSGLCPHLRTHSDPACMWRRFDRECGERRYTPETYARVPDSYGPASACAKSVADFVEACTSDA